MELREPKDITVLDGEGKERKFVLSKMPAWDALEIMTRLPPSLAVGSVPKIGDWGVVKDLQQRIMNYVAIRINNVAIPLSTQALIDNHTGDWICLGRLMIEEVEYNKGFFYAGTISNFFADIARQYLAKISETLNHSSAPSLQPEKQPSTNSAPSTP